jgi:hypothetical protein
MKFHVESLLSALMILSRSTLVALPTGAPICSIDVDRIATGHTKPSDAALDYELKSEKVNDNTYQISIQSKVETIFKGVLIYVIGNDPKTHLGSFVLPNDNFKFQSDACKSEGINGAVESTVTHSNPSDKSLSEIKFTWSFSKDKDQGPFKVMAVVAKDRNPWKGVKELALEDVFVAPYQTETSSCTSSTTTSSCTSSTTTSSCTSSMTTWCSSSMNTWCSSTMTSSTVSCSTAGPKYTTSAEPVHKVFKCTKVKKEWKSKY